MKTRMTAAALLAALSLAVLGAAAPAGAEAQKKPKGTLQAQRAGWMLGMYVGEEKGQPYPFVLQVDPASDARIKGVRAGDELMKFQDGETAPLSRLFDKVNALRPGREIVIWVRRGSQNIQMTLRVPKDPGAAPVENKEDKKKEPGAEEKKAKPEKKRPPVVIKPIPADQ